MKRSLTGFVVVTLTIVLTAGTWAAQKKKPTRNGSANATPTSSSSAAGSSEPELPGDPRLAKMERDFVIEVAGLAKEYERKKDLDRARECYEQILKLVPHHPDAERKLKEIRGKEMMAEKKKLTVRATDGWQDTGINVIANRPLSIHAEGTWTFRMEQVLDADGMEIPKELKEFNLGCLVGKIVSAGSAEENQPFMVGKDVEIAPDQPGRLWLRMYDSDPTDNKGLLSVEILGTFEKGK
ncbi:MAG TPA: tetratricopeptide repeat protein [Pirellulales bacterium]|nr:tetratricopeptide repeat protein [Pirellulales bacterium]